MKDWLMPALINQAQDLLIDAAIVHEHAASTQPATEA
jgi:hypothetical protein